MNLSVCLSVCLSVIAGMIYFEICSKSFSKSFRKAYTTHGLEKEFIFKVIAYLGYGWDIVPGFIIFTLSKIGLYSVYITPM